MAALARTSDYPSVTTHFLTSYAVGKTGLEEHVSDLQYVPSYGHRRAYPSYERDTVGPREGGGLPDLHAPPRFGRGVRAVRACQRLI